MSFQLIPLRAKRTKQLKSDMQTAFQHCAEDGFGTMDEAILPESHIDRSLETKGSITYEALFDGEMVGGAIVVINGKTQHNYLDFPYVKNGLQSKGVGHLASL